MLIYFMNRGLANKQEKSRNTQLTGCGYLKLALTQKHTSPISAVLSRSRVRCPSTREVAFLAFSVLVAFIVIMRGLVALSDYEVL